MAIFSKNIDMLNGTIWDKMVVFAIPLALTGVLQQLYNLADVAVLGHFVSNEAVAAVGHERSYRGPDCCLLYRPFHRRKRRSRTVFGYAQIR